MEFGARSAPRAVSRRNVHPAGDPNSRSEIHPPLPMATAPVVTGSLATGATTGPDVTRVSRRGGPPDWSHDRAVTDVTDHRTAQRPPPDR
jgi:hypothetical protein